MRTGSVRGVEQGITRVVLGTAGLSTSNRDAAFSVLDEYAAAGGNCLDTAWIYGEDGSSERLVGEWIDRRAVRSEVVLVAKGACTTECTPDLIERELCQSFERMQVDYADIYMMHRDNPSVPAGEFVDVLNSHMRQGRMRAFGGSNWSTKRLAEANAYAAAHGLTGFSVSSPNFALAQWNEPTWAATTTASDAASREWYQANDVALFAWSSQAGGLFTGRYDESDIDNPAAADMVRVWFNDDNFERIRRAKEIAQQLGLTATQVALAFVLNQPFETFALVGPLTPAEVRSSLAGANLRLSPDELRYLTLE